MSSVEELFLEHAAERLDRYCGRIITCLDKLTPDQIWMRGSENENAVGNLVLHLNGNVRQWIVSGIGGEADVRVRHEEFATQGGLTAEELAARLKGTVDGAIEVVRNLPHGQLTERRNIQGYDVSVLEAIFNVTEHFSGHAAQIVFVTKMFTGENLGFSAYLDKTGYASGQKA